MEKKQFIDAKIENIGGMPAFVIDGKPMGAMTYQWSLDEEKSPWQLKNIGEAGVELFFVNTVLGDPDDFEQTWERLKKSIHVLKENVPNAKAMLWLMIFPYPEFAEKYPDDVIVFNDGKKGDWLIPEFMHLPDNHTPRFSFASDAWKNEVGSMLKELIHRIGESDLCKTIVGYFFFALCYEWSWFWDYDKDVHCLDYSKAMHKAFRDFLIDKYTGSEEKLKKAWKNPNVTFETTSIT